MTNSGVETFLYQFDYGMGKYKGWTFPDKPITENRCVVLCNQDSPDTYWETFSAFVNLCVPDKNGTADTKTLEELESMGKAMFKDIPPAQIGDEWYFIMISRVTKEEDTNLKCHYISIKLNFKILNV